MNATPHRLNVSHATKFTYNPVTGPNLKNFVCGDRIIMTVPHKFSLTFTMIIATLQLTNNNETPERNVMAPTTIWTVDEGYSY
jgi:hypothetical protein